MQKSTAALYKYYMFRCTVHYNLPQDPFFPICIIFPLQIIFLHSLLQNDVLIIVSLIKHREQLFPQLCCKPV